MSRVTAIYPGSFDPVTNGHLDMVRRASKIFDRVIVAVLLNTEKTPLFSPSERVAMLGAATSQWHNVEVATFDGLLVDFAVAQEAQVVLRGIRAVTDYDYEFQMALMNRRLCPQLETVFMVPGEEFSFLSSSLVKEVYRLGGKISGLVPQEVEAKLAERIGKRVPGEGFE